MNVEIPVLNRHLFSARGEAAHYERLAEGQRLRDQQGIEQDVRHAWMTASTAFKSIPVTEQFLRSAQLALEVVQGRYSLGLSSIVKITQAQLNLTQTQIEDVCAKYDYQSAFCGPAIYDRRTTVGSLRDPPRNRSDVNRGSYVYLHPEGHIFSI